MTEDGTFPAGGMKIRDFQRLAAVIHGYSGIRMPPAKKTMVEGRLRRRLRALGLSGFDEYCRLLFEEDGLDGELVSLIDAVSTNKTDFFREEEHFRFLVSRVLPDLFSRSHRPGFGRPLKVWSAACSTGAEPYTLAMVFDDVHRSRRDFTFAILGTDISTAALAKARLGIYPAEMIDPVPAEMRKRHFLRARDPKEHTVRLSPSIRQMVRYARLNLMDESYPIDDDMDVIFCRNVLFYFDKETQCSVLRRLCRHLRPGGYFFVSHSESLAGLDLPFDQAATSVFVRR